ncbi:MAG: glycosyltransferase family 2 protein [Prevotella sp.]|nr:glycosyltransferase family 2 protein [Prevotella sp.]
MKRISILIPTYNDECTTLVKELQKQAERLRLTYEIIVADDGSTNLATVALNQELNTLPHCRTIERQVNKGRAAIRNFLASQAQYEWLLFIDSDMTVCRKNYLECYAMTEGTDVVDGGIIVGQKMKGNLRSCYESAAEAAFTAEKRTQSPYRDFHTANFMVRSEVFRKHPFDERFRHYGYEDVLMGKELERNHIPILHIDNPMSFEIFEDNSHFVSKTEEGLRTLHQFRDELQGYSRLLDFVESMPKWLCIFFIGWHKVFGPMERQWLVGQHPNLTLFNVYRLGYFLSL